jgi:hypothetical protein
MYKINPKVARKESYKVLKIKQKEVKQYQKFLKEYVLAVSYLATKRLSDTSQTSLEGHLNDRQDTLGVLLANPPKLGNLSLPGFLGNDSNIDQDDQELIDLPHGYLYIYRKKDIYRIIFHVEKPDHYNPYLDVHRTFKQSIPMIVRDNGLLAANVFSLSKIISFIKIF